MTRQNIHRMQLIYRINKKVLMLSMMLTLTGISSCKKLVEVDAPGNRITGSNVYNNDATAAAVLTGIYTAISTAKSLSDGISSLSMHAGLSADELTLWTGASNQDQIRHYTNTLTALPDAIVVPWNTI